jgi:hypothetical protein
MKIKNLKKNMESSPKAYSRHNLAFENLGKCHVNLRCQGMKKIIDADRGESVNH